MKDLHITYTYNTHTPLPITYNKHLNTLTINMLFQEVLTPSFIADTVNRILGNNVPESVIEAIYDHCKQMEWSKDVTVVFCTHVIHKL